MVMFTLCNHDHLVGRLEPYATADKLQCLNEAELRVAIVAAGNIADAFRDTTGDSLLNFRLWFVRTQLVELLSAAIVAATGDEKDARYDRRPIISRLRSARFHLQIGRASAARAAMAQLVGEELAETRVPTRALLGLHDYMVDYLTLPGLSRYMLTNIVRAQLGLRTINGSIPAGWAGLTFAAMVHEHRRLTIRLQAVEIVSKLIPEHELEGVADDPLIQVGAHVRAFLRHPTAEPYCQVPEPVFTDMMRLYLGLPGLGFLPLDAFNGNVMRMMQKYLALNPDRSSSAHSASY